MIRRETNPLEFQERVAALMSFSATVVGAYVTARNNALKKKKSAALAHDAGCAWCANAFKMFIDNAGLRVKIGGAK